MMVLLQFNLWEKQKKREKKKKGKKKNTSYEKLKRKVKNESHFDIYFESN